MVHKYLETLINAVGDRPSKVAGAIVSEFCPQRPIAIKKSSKLSAYTTEQIWQHLEATDFKCERCGSRYKVTVIETDSALETVCNKCKHPEKPNALESLMFAYCCQEIENNRPFPTQTQLAAKLKLKSLGNLTYTYKWLKKILQVSVDNRTQED